MIIDRNTAYTYLREKAQGLIQTNEQDEIEVLKYFTKEEIEEMSFIKIPISECCTIRRE